MKLNCPTEKLLLKYDRRMADLGEGRSGMVSLRGNLEPLSLRQELESGEGRHLPAERGQRYWEEKEQRIPILGLQNSDNALFEGTPDDFAIALLFLVLLLLPPVLKDWMG